jgi:hypothetical protein
MSGSQGKLVTQFPTNADAPEGGRNPHSVSCDEPHLLSPKTRNHSFFVRTKRTELLSNINVLELMAKCPDVGDGEGVTIHKDVLFSLCHHLLDKVHESETSQRGQTDSGPRYDEKLSKALDTLGDRDAEVKELRAALGEAAIKIRRLETKIFK